MIGRRLAAGSYPRQLSKGRRFIRPVDNHRYIIALARCRAALRGLRHLRSPDYRCRRRRRLSAPAERAVEL